jgi:hypothetical protein
MVKSEIRFVALYCLGGGENHKRLFKYLLNCYSLGLSDEVRKGDN